MSDLQSAALALAGVTAAFLFAAYLAWRMRRSEPATAAPMVRYAMEVEAPRQRRLPALARRSRTDEPEIEIAPSRLARVRGETPIEAPTDAAEEADAAPFEPAPEPTPVETLAAALEEQVQHVEQPFDAAPPEPRDVASVQLVPQIPLRDPIDRHSRIGGRPRLPASMDWPRIDGALADFLGQIACADLPDALWDGAGPRHGSLAIFAHPGTGAGHVLHLAEAGEPRDPPQPVGEALFAPHGDRRFGDLAPLAIRAFPEWPVDIVGGPVDDAPAPAPDGADASDDAEYDIADPAFHPFDWDSMRMLAAVLERRIARLPTEVELPADASDEYAAALAEAAAINRDTSEGVAEIVAIIGESAGGHDFTASDATAVMAALHAVRWAHVVCTPDPETGEDRVETLSLPLTRHDPRAPLWAHDYRALLFDHAKHAWTANPGVLSAPACAWVEPLWRSLALGELATMGGLPSAPLPGFDPATEVVLIALPTSALMSRRFGDGDTMVLTLDKAALARGDFARVKTLHARG